MARQPSRPSCRRKPAQLEFDVRPRTWGGKREGAGRKPGPSPRVLHRARPPLASRYPVHVTLKVNERLPDLRDDELHQAVEGCLAAGKEREGFRLVHYSFMSHHFHLIVEATGAEQLTNGIRGLCTRLARAINQFCNRRGPVFSDRYFARILKNPRQVRNCIAYVLLNCRRHASKHGRTLLPSWIDDCSSGRFFDGWRHRPPPPGEHPTVARAGTWLLATGWRRWGLLLPDEVPGPDAPG